MVFHYILNPPRIACMRSAKILDKTTQVSLTCSGRRSHSMQFIIYEPRHCFDGVSFQLLYSSFLCFSH